MDIFAHALWAGAGATKLNEELEKKNKSKISILWSSLWGIFPDFFAFSIPTIWSLALVILGGKTLSEISHHGPQTLTGSYVFDLASYLYQFSHSIPIFLLIFGGVWFVTKQPHLAMLGWLFHILQDIPSHNIIFYPTPFLFPISDYYFQYGVRWSTGWFMILNYSLLLIICTYFIFKKRKSRK